MAPSCAVLIAATHVLSAFTQRAALADAEVLAFADTDVLRALEAITARKPRMVALERLFAATPRGAALINRIKADPSLVQTEIRVLSHDSDYSRVLPRTTTSGSGPAPPARATDAERADSAEAARAPASSPSASLAFDRPSSPAAAGASAPAAASAAKIEPASTAATLEPQPEAHEAAAQRVPLDQTGTRRAPRYTMAHKVDVLIDGNPANLLELSTCGAQVISPTILRPNQRVRMALTDETGVLRFNAAIAWASFEIPPQIGPQYRAGIDFVDADAAAIEAFCVKHRV